MLTFIIVALIAFQTIIYIGHKLNNSFQDRFRDRLFNIVMLKHIYLLTELFIAN